MRRSLFPELAYTFKHALTHEVAYGSLQQEQRKALHARIIGAIETLFADRLAEQVERLALPCPAGRGVGQSPSLLSAGRGEGHGTVGPPRSGRVLREGTQRPLTSPGPAHHARAGHRSPARPIHGAARLRRVCTHPGGSARSRSPRRVPRRRALASTGLRLSVKPFPHHGCV